MDPTIADQAVSLDDPLKSYLSFSDLEKTGYKTFDLSMTGEDGSTFTLHCSARLKGLYANAGALAGLPDFPYPNLSGSKDSLPAEQARSDFRDRYLLRGEWLQNNKPLALREWRDGDWELIDRASQAVLATYTRAKSRHKPDRPESAASETSPIDLISSSEVLLNIGQSPDAKPVDCRILTIQDSTLKLPDGIEVKLWDEDFARYDSKFVKLPPFRVQYPLYLELRADGALAIKNMVDPSYEVLWFLGPDVANGPDGQFPSFLSETKLTLNGSINGSDFIQWTWTIPANIPKAGIMTRVISNTGLAMDYLTLYPAIPQKN